MQERAHPNRKEFKNKFFGLIKSKYAKNLQKRYAFADEYVKGKVVLDIPCGMGWGTSLLTGYRSAYGIDISEEAIREAKRRYPEIKFEKGNMIKISLKDNFCDVAVCLEGLEHITFSEGQKFMKEIKRVLRNKGLLILSSPLLVDNRYHSGNIYHSYEYKENELLDMLDQRGFRIIEKQYLDAAKTKIVLLCLENIKN